MATSVRDLDSLRSAAAVTQHQLLRRDLLRLRNGVIYHADATTAPTVVTTATDLPTAIARLNAVRTAYVAHIASACSATTGQGAHLAADATNTISAVAATDLASAETLANEIKGDYNLHRASTTFHPSADSTNTITSTDATDLASLIALVNELGTDVAAHLAAAFASQAIALVAP